MSSSRKKVFYIEILRQILFNACSVKSIINHYYFSVNIDYSLLVSIINHYYFSVNIDYSLLVISFYLCSIVCVSLFLNSSVCLNHSK